jgi:hypothetical protein
MDWDRFTIRARCTGVCLVEALAHLVCPNCSVAGKKERGSAALMAEDFGMLAGASEPVQRRGFNGGNF